MQLAKPAVDVGLYTNDREAMLTFWQERISLPFAEMLRVGNGVQQHRHAIGDSVLKVNHSRDPLPAEAQAGIRHLLIVSERVDEATELFDPDGNRITQVPPGFDAITQLRVEMTVSDLARHQDFYGGILELPELDANTFCCGASQIRLSEGEATADPIQRAPGYRYLTLQIFDVKGVHAQVVAKGGREGTAPVKLGDVAHISFVRDPDGNWLELSQRKSITGTLD